MMKGIVAPTEIAKIALKLDKSMVYHNDHKLMSPKLIPAERAITKITKQRDFIV